MSHGLRLAEAGRHIYYKQYHQPLLAQDHRSPADQESFAGCLRLSEPDPFEIAAVRIRELAHSSQPL